MSLQRTVAHSFLARTMAAACVAGAAGGGYALASSGHAAPARSELASITTAPLTLREVDRPQPVRVVKVVSVVRVTPKPVAKKTATPAAASNVAARSATAVTTDPVALCLKLSRTDADADELARAFFAPIVSAAGSSDPATVQAYCTSVVAAAKAANDNDADDQVATTDRDGRFCDHAGATSGTVDPDATTAARTYDGWRSGDNTTQVSFSGLRDRQFSGSYSGYHR